jgi:hypothetical protein
VHGAGEAGPEQVGLVGGQDGVGAAHHRYGHRRAQAERVQRQRGAAAQHGLDHRGQRQVQRQRPGGKEDEGVLAADLVGDGSPSQAPTCKPIAAQHGILGHLNRPLD